MKRFSYPVGLLIVVIFVVPGWVKEVSGGEITLEALLQEAREANPAIQAARSRWKAAEYKIKSVKSLDDPMASYGFLEKKDKPKSVHRNKSMVYRRNFLSLENLN